ncbi:large ribosomal subunit protein uL30m [Syngnathus scovelli]|uniref:large ribosomal subunit protein uL30m n=1 Tax=Syngnathus scovelli TaxID=161590 RepID=UPI0021104DB3|nr:39S ribosomal protein L30, mitochondrial [Syngnathus scovelli]
MLEATEMSAFSLKSSSVKVLTGISRCILFGRSKFTRARIPQEFFEERSKEHEKYGGDPEQPHKLHVVTRVRSAMRRPYWEKDMVKNLGLQKPHVPVIHKNTPAVNNKLKVIKHLVRIQPLRTPYGLPTEQDMADSYINSNGELIVRRLLTPIQPKAIES